MREIQRRTVLKVCFHFLPRGFLAGVGEQILNDGGALNRFGNVKEWLAGNPSVGSREVPTFSGARAEDGFYAIVAHVERLAAALNAVADLCDGLFAQNLLKFARRQIRALDNCFLDSTDFK